MLHDKVLVVDDEGLIRWSLKERLGREGYTVLEAATGGAAVEQAAVADLVLLDFRLPDMDGLAVLRRLKETAPDTPVILMTAFSTVENAVDAMRQGAYHYVRKPFDLDDVVVIVDKALETGRLRREVRAFRSTQTRDYSFDMIVGQSPDMRVAKDVMARVAASPVSPVLLTGESGTGKDLAAKAIHYHSPRASRQLVNMTCSAVPEALLESELFGHERGAFTDARQQKRGLFELADGGTLFLDEIGELALGLQARLLRVIEEKAFTRVGGLQDIRVDVRVVAATHRDLEEEVRRGTFREDLFHRLQVMPVRLPPLRERHGDIPLLAQWYIERYNQEFRKRVHGLSPRALAALEQYAWPGNVRELRNVIERAMLLTERTELALEELGALNGATSGPLFTLPPEGAHLGDVARQLLVQALDRSGWNQTHAGRLLGINRDQVRYRIEKFGLTPPTPRAVVTSSGR